MESLSFVIAKKMEKPPANEGGIRLGSFRADAESGVLALMSPDPAGLKDSIAAFRSLTGIPIQYRVRGKSIQIAAESVRAEASPAESVSADGADGAFGMLLEFAKGLSFRAEDVADVFEFCAGEHSYPFGTLRLLSIDMDRSRTEISAELVTGGASGGEPDADAADQGTGQGADDGREPPEDPD
ncbi:MAG: hypothetical protein II173_04560, partial [Firmicutes bacterium]|nr:hypothetical protein [Bacillota bacterium]